MQLTWKKQYTGFNNWLVKQGFSDDYKKVVSNPDLAFEDSDIDILSAMWFWDINKCNLTADTLPTGSSQANFDKLTVKINRGLLENHSRKDIFEKAFKTFNK